MWTFFGLLIVWSGLSITSTLPDNALAACRARAWVRAPNLEPGQIVQGDVKVKLDGSCDDVSSYSLGLRFAERSWVKTRREGATLPKYSKWGLLPFSIFGWGRKYAWQKYQRDMENPALWLVREEERIGFETNHILRDGQLLGHDLVERFAILVPSTNYPSAFASLGPDGPESLDRTNAAGAEHIYAYYVDVTFKNGTRRQIPAGYTSFNAVTTPQSPSPETIEAAATRFSWGNKASKETEDLTSRDAFTLEVTFPNGRYFEQGSTNNVSIVSRQLGPGLKRSLGLKYLNTHVSQKHRWAANLAADNESAEALLSRGTAHRLQMWPKMNEDWGIYQHRSNPNNVLTSPRFTQDGVIENGTTFRTEAITGQFEVPLDCYPPFDMYYQTSQVELQFPLEVRDLSSAKASPPGTAVDDEEYYWTPTLPRMTEICYARIPIFIYRKPETHEMVHYLSSEARTPIFVDPASITALLRKTVEDRDVLAPIAQAKFVRPADGDIVKHRYYGEYMSRGAPAGPHYVGDTWLRKVLAKGDGRNSAVKVDPLVIQA